MEDKLVLELSNHNVYYIKTEMVNYYITVPKNVKNTNICIELKNKMGNYDIELNDEIWVLENIRTTFSYIDNYNITLVLPVLKNEQISILEKIDSNKFEQIDKILGNIINNSYLFLKNNNIVVSNQIILVNNDRYKTFINWFITRYRNRVVCKNLLELIQFYNANATSYKKLETPVMNFVVGSYNTEIEAPRVEKGAKEIKIDENVSPQFSYGYATYWILAGVTLVVSLVVAVIAWAFK